MMDFPSISKKVNSVNDNRKSFTLVEMIVVMAIILMLSLLCYGVIVRTTKKVEQMQCNSNLKNLNYAFIMYLQDNGMYPRSARYAPSGEEGSLVDALAGFLDNQYKIFVCPSTDELFKFNKLSYVYHEGIERNATNDWLLVCARLPENPNPHLGDMANNLWVDGHVKAEQLEVPDE